MDLEFNVYGREKNLKVKYIFLGIFGAFMLTYIISYMYNRTASGQITVAGEKEKSVCIYQDGAYEIVDVEEYVQQVLTGMADDNWNMEMLRTVSVIIRTGIYYQMDKNSKNDSKNGGNTNLINEADLREIRYTEDELREMWGNDYKKIINMTAEAVSDTRGVIIRYDGNVILPVYHLVSIGHTISADELFGRDVPYLRQVASDADRMADDFSCTKIYSGDRLRKTFQKWIGDETDAEVKVTRATASGYAHEISVFGNAVDAELFKDQLGLASTNIHIDCQENEYRIITVGVGDSLGLSLYGAGILAANGESYEEILRYYYTGVTVGR